MSSRIPEMLNMLHTMITEAWSVPLGAEKCVIDRDKALDILDEIRGQFPTEISEAKRLLDARVDFINNAKQEADAIKKNAEEHARKLIDEQEVVKIARGKSNEMLAHAETSTSELRRVANEYVDDAMQRTEESLAAAMEEIRQSRQRFRQAARVASEASSTAPPTEPPKHYGKEIDFDIE
ncbi:MAG: hypothetical protein FWD05_00375 [Oscillospiraceae bacterium]|nr:hypothetical protein [Oscillospiraceae bacterium]